MSCEVKGFTAVPRWTRTPKPGVGEHDVPIPDDVMTALRELAKTLTVPLSAALLAGHAKVLGVLSGEREVCTGYAVGTNSPLPLRMTLGPGSWREVVQEVARAESALMSTKDVPAGDPGADPSQQSFETVFGLAQGGGELAEGIVLRIGFVERNGFVLRLRYRTDVLDADGAARIAGFHVTALSLIAAQPDAEHAQANAALSHP